MFSNIATFNVAYFHDTKLFGDSADWPLHPEGSIPSADQEKDDKGIVRIAIFVMTCMYKLIKIVGSS